MAKSAFSPNNGRMVEGPLAGSSTDNAVVRWDSTTGRVLQDAAGLTLSDTWELKLYNTGLTDYAAFSHDGSDFYTSVANTGNWLISGFTAGGGVQLRNGAYLYILDPSNANYSYFTHDGTDFNLIGVSTTDLNITGVTAITIPGQIKFPASQSASSDANTLDDYEEGTWTPAFTFETPGDLSVTYTSSRAGYYTKVGNSVNLNYNCTLSTCTYTTASGFANVTGLPFTNHAAAGARTHGVVAPGLASGSIGTTYSTIEGSGTVLRLYFVNHTGGGLDALAVAHMPTARAYNVEGALHHRV